MAHDEFPDLAAKVQPPLQCLKPSKNFREGRPCKTKLFRDYDVRTRVSGMWVFEVAQAVNHGERRQSANGRNFFADSDLESTEKMKEDIESGRASSWTILREGRYSLIRFLALSRPQKLAIRMVHSQTSF